MNCTNLTYSCQAHLPVQFASNIELSDIGVVVIDSEPHLSHTCKTSLLFASLSACVQAVLRFSILHADLTVYTIIF